MHFILSAFAEQLGSFVPRCNRRYGFVVYEKNTGLTPLFCMLQSSPPPFPQIDIIGAVVIVWRVRGKTIRSVLFRAILCATIVHSAMHTHMNRLTVRWIGFCLTGPISLCLD